MSTKSFNQSNIRQHANRCVCEICTCGNHKCPSTAHQYSSDLAKSTFQKDYVKHPPCASQSFKIQQEAKLHRYNPEQLRTSYMNEYKPYRVQTAQPNKRNVAEIQLNLPFPKGSEYNQNFIKFDSALVSPIHRPVYKKIDAPFIGSSIYKSDYNKRQVAKEPVVLRNEGELNYPKDYKFNGHSTYKDDYLKYQSSPANSFKPGKRQYNPIPFNGVTEYKTQYNGFDPRIYENHMCPVEELPPRPPQLQPGQSHLKFKPGKLNWE